jgi:threonine dehydratase
MNVTGWRCAACGSTVAVSTPMPWRCPNATRTDRHHVLHIERALAPLRPVDDANPYVAYDVELAWAAFADAHGMDGDARTALIRSIDDRVAAVAGHGFRRTPMSRQAALSDALGFAPGGGVWVKDETGNVAGSHKARHLVTVLAHLLAAEELALAPWTAPGGRAPLAIASCGNAALAAATLARAVAWPLEVFVPPWAATSTVAHLDELGAMVRVCPRRDTDPPGDPCVHRFRDAVEAGAVPFSVQGPENALCLDGGRTLGWEIVEDLGHTADRVFVQVGGGAFATSVGAAFGAGGIHPCLHAVQTEGCAPLARAWERARAGAGGVAGSAARWSECMWPWESPPTSAADGILDDETYDWVGVVRAMAAGGGSPVVVPEALVVEAHRLGVATTGIAASATGTAGLAGLLAIREQVADDERVVVVFSGLQR